MSFLVNEIDWWTALPAEGSLIHNLMAKKEVEGTRLPMTARMLKQTEDKCRKHCDLAS